MEAGRSMQMSMTAPGFLTGDRPLRGPSEAEGPRPLSLRRNATWSTLGCVAYAASQWGIFVILAKLGTPEMVGQYALGLAVTGPIFMLANLQLRVIQATDVRGAYRFGDHLALRLVTSAAALGAVAIVALACGFRAGTAAVVVGVAVLKALESFSEIIHGLLQKQERMDRIAAMQSLKGGLAVVAMGVGVTTTGRVLVGVGMMACVWILGQFLFEWPCAAWALGEGRLGELKPRWNPATMRKLAWRALPLGIVMMLASLFVNIPRYAIERSLGEATLGTYSAIAYLIVAVGTINNALGQAASPRLARSYAEGDVRGFSILLAGLGGFGLLAGLAGIGVSLVAGEEVLTLIYGPSYARHSALFVWIMTASAAAGVAAPLGYGMTAAGRYRAQLPLFALVTLSSAAASYRLVPSFGLIGGAWALLFAYVVLLLGSVWVLLGAFPRRYGAQS